jgi:lipoyl(octanoyl) transferase
MIPELTPAVWRLLDTGFQNGPTNMAVDEAIVEAVARGDSPPTLRFYGWQPACLSLGLGQSWRVVNQEACRALGWDFVRRTTGGRAILHVDELTYSVCAPQNEPRVVGSILESYRRLSLALLAGLRLMGLTPAQAEPAYAKLGEEGAACFDAPSNYEVTVNGRKLIGSAQARKKGVVLQHGTLPLVGDITRISQALNQDETEQAAMRRQLQQHAITLADCLPAPVGYAEAVAFMSDGFRQTLALDLQPGQLSPQEQARAAELRAEKYANPSWTERR